MTRGMRASWSAAKVFLRVEAKLLLAAGVMLSLALSAPAEAALDSSPRGVLVLKLDPSKTHQTMVGFGASDAWRLQMVGNYWPEEKKNRIADLLFSSRISDNGKPEGIGLSLWRFYIGSGSREQGRKSGIVDEWRRTECFQNPDGTYDWSKQEGQRWFLKAARARGVPGFLAFSIAAPAHLALNGKAHGTGTNSMNIQPGKMADYARFLAEVMEHFERQLNLPFHYLSPVNEPQWDWAKANNQEGTAVSNAECHEFVSLLGRELHRRNLGTKLVFGEAGNISYLYSPNKLPDRGDQIRDFFSKDSKHFLGGIPNVANVISGHSYGTTWPLEVLVSNRMSLRQTLDQVSPQTGYWQTEFCILENTGEVGSGRKRDLDMDTALYVARVIHADLAIAGAASWQWWTAVTRFDFKDGLICIDNGKSSGLRFADADYARRDGEIRTSKLLWALGNYSLFVRPGMVRIAANLLDGNEAVSEQCRGLMVSAYADKRTQRQVIVFVNCGGEDRSVAIPTTKGSAIAAYVTSETLDLQKQTAGKDAIAIPRRSVVTVVLDGSLAL
jgi:O-glycosyl hydrolase